MTEFIPPYPPRYKEWPNPLDIIKYARQDLLSFWPSKAFQVQFTGMSILTKGFFLANCPDAVHHVMTQYGEKNPLMRKALAPLLGDGFDSDAETWYKVNSNQTELFNPAFVSLHNKTITDSMENYVWRWESLTSAGTINVLPEMRNLTAEISCKLLFDRKLSVEKAREMLSIFSQYQDAVEKMDISLFLGLPGWLPKFGGNPITKAAKEIHKITDDFIAQGTKNDNQDTVLSHLLTVRDGSHPNGLTATQLRNELNMLFMAGQETMANTLSWAWYLISQSADVEKKLHEELDCVLGERSATLDDLDKLIFTRAIIDESLRLYPPIPLLSREATGYDVIRNREIPAGSIMLVVPWLLHRHEKFWHKPNHFMPERFLEGTRPHKFAFLPFSGMPSECSAQFFGTVVATLSLATLAKNFRLTLPEGQEVTHECHLTLRPKNDLPMLITKR
jgi:cytochrome P450